MKIKIVLPLKGTVEYKMLTLDMEHELIKKYKFKKEMVRKYLCWESIRETTLIQLLKS